MKVALERTLFWAPRILTILYAIFISMFALDVFSEGNGLWRTILALLMHLIPTAIVVLVLIISWRWEIVGALVFAAGALFYVFKAMKHPSWIVLISGPLFLVAILFLLNWLLRKELRRSS